MSFYLIIRGPLGCGKSTISKKLADELGAEHIAIDSVLDENGLTYEKEEGYISQNNFKKANELIEPMAKKFLEAGVPVIFDGNFYWQSAIEDLTGRLAYPYTVFTMKVPLEICIQRDKERTKSYGEDAVTVVYNKTVGFSYGTEIDATGSIQDTLSKIKEFLKSSDSIDLSKFS